MKSELIVDVQPKDISIALLEDGRLMSLQREARNVKYAVGDVYFGKVKKLMPGLNAAFVDIGSFDTCTTTCCPSFSTSETEPCLSMSGRHLNLESCGIFEVSPIAP